MQNFILTLGISRGFAFMEFYSTDDAVKWMADNRVRELGREPQMELCTIVVNRTYSHYMDIL